MIVSVSTEKGAGRPGKEPKLPKGRYNGESIT